MMKMDDGSIESHRYFLSRKTTLEMLKDRGYSIPSSEIQLSLSEFRQIHGQSPDVDRLRFSATHATNPSKRVSLSLSLNFFFFCVSIMNNAWFLVGFGLQILVIFSGQGVVKVNSIRNIAGQIVNKDTLTGLILIVQNQITSQALKAVNLLSFKVEIFQVCVSLIPLICSAGDVFLWFWFSSQWFCLHVVFSNLIRWYLFFIFINE